MEAITIDNLFTIDEITQVILAECTDYGAGCLVFTNKTAYNAVRKNGALV